MISGLNVTQPLFVMALVNYIKDGQNALGQGAYNFHFIDCSGISWLSWLTEE